MAISIKPSERWLASLEDFVRPDFERGQLWWLHPRQGRNMSKPVGCLDGNGYVKVQINHRPAYAHQVLFFLYHGYWPELVDHDNKNNSDNRIGNLIDSNHSKNGLNSKVWNTNTSGVKGVSVTSCGNYKVTKRGVHLGTFKELEEARIAYNKHR